jgi:hypothetical protein
MMTTLVETCSVMKRGETFKVDNFKQVLEKDALHVRRLSQGCALIRKCVYVT